MHSCSALLVYQAVLMANILPSWTTMLELDMLALIELAELAQRRVWFDVHDTDGFSHDRSWQQSSH
jgi:hypothetical protein